MSPWKVEISGAPVVGIVVPSAKIKGHSIANRLIICAVDSAVSLVSGPNAQSCKIHDGKDHEHLFDICSKSVGTSHPKKYRFSLSKRQY